MFKDSTYIVSLVAVDVPANIRADVSVSVDGCPLSGDVSRVSTRGWISPEECGHFGHWPASYHVSTRHPDMLVTLTVVASTHHSCNGAARQERRPPCACVHRCEVDVWAGWGCLANWRMVSVSPCLTPPLGRVNSVLMKICRGALYFHFGSLQRSNW